MDVAPVFEKLSKHRGVAAAVVFAVAAAGTAVWQRNSQADGALAGVARQLVAAKVDERPDAQLISKTATFTNQSTGTPGKFELLGRDLKQPNCFQVAISGGDYALTTASVPAKAASAPEAPHDLPVPLVTRVCPAKFTH